MTFFIIFHALIILNKMDSRNENIDTLLKQPMLPCLFPIGLRLFTLLSILLIDCLLAFWAWFLLISVYFIVNLNYEFLKTFGCVCFLYF